MPTCAGPRRCGACSPGPRTGSTRGCCPCRRRRSMRQQNGWRPLQAHQYPQQQHRVVNLAASHRAEAAGRTLAQCDAALHLGRLGGTRGPEDAAHVRVGLDREHLMARAGQPDGLRPLPGAHIEDSRGRRPQVLIELAGDHLLPDHVTHVSQPAEPGHTTITERAASARVARIHHRDDIILIVGPLRTQRALGPSGRLSRRPPHRGCAAPASLVEWPRRRLRGVTTRPALAS